MKANQALANRLEAEMRGDKTYRGRPCKHGHDGTRFTRNNMCVSCQRQHSKSPYSGYDERKAVMEAMTPFKPSNPVTDCGWPFDRFTDDPRAAKAGTYIANLRKLPFVRAA